MTSQPLAASPSQLECFVAVRLLAGGKPPTKSDLDKTLRRYFAERVAMPAAQWRSLLDAALERMLVQGLVLAKPLRLTEAGRVCAFDFLGVESLPPNIKWQTLRNRYLIARALSTQPRSKAEWDRLGTADGLRAAVLAKQHQLPLGPVPTPARVLHALAWLQLRKVHAGVLPLDKDFSRNAVLGLALLAGRISRKPEEGLAAQAAGSASTHPDKVREAVICRWLQRQEGDEPDESVPAGAAPERKPPAGAPPRSLDRAVAFDLRAFAARVREIARSSPSGWFGEQKVFIAHVWNRFQQEPDVGDLTREEFDRHLVAANREDLLTLSRADLVSGMDHNDVQQSEIRLPHGSFHFIRTDR